MLELENHVEFGPAADRCTGRLPGRPRTASRRSESVRSCFPGKTSRRSSAQVFVDPWPVRVVRFAVGIAGVRRLMMPSGSSGSLEIRSMTSRRNPSTPRSSRPSHHGLDGPGGPAGSSSSGRAAGVRTGGGSTHRMAGSSRQADPAEVGAQLSGGSPVVPAGPPPSTSRVRGCPGLEWDSTNQGCWSEAWFDHDVQHDLQVPAVGLVDQLVEVRHGAEERVDRLVVGRRR